MIQSFINVVVLYEWCFHTGKCSAVLNYYYYIDLSEAFDYNVCLFLLFLSSPLFLSDLSKCKFNPSRQSSTWECGPLAWSRDHVPQTDCVRGVCMSQRQALSVPCRELLHLPDHQQCVSLELRKVGGQWTTQHQKGLPLPFLSPPFSFFLYFLMSFNPSYICF